ncbi:phytanoyl-CoA dioxygenase family protein [Paraburkholderia lycopersici]|uniref:Ectoine hydroxylase-related dioxygenase, phytanoyl-CoA dioxygenase (PhyH) family n=1 Tax=Paraburkholderia lycopersici TaxID=416944 RepID=A0A1G6SKP5_9BURK|nr:phytanoyl-CoA dioxygenase family protein [Paraburkholderia lycopersici]SDD17472.1 Ectoine hydroxylase-related dioxygenase, phytanoyl-CoA dioxygenase (PhyH) family [Paraburkholderia lycopersici]
MNQHEVRAAQSGRQWYVESECSLDAFVNQLHDDGSPLRFASDVKQGIPVYDCRVLEGALHDAPCRAQLQAEWAHVLRDGAGVLVLARAYADTQPVDAATAVFEAIIRAEREQGSRAADHFAKAGANDRIWNAQQKLCLEAPAVFVDYFANLPLMAVCEAWLGPCYQMTSQVNVVRPGGEAQQAHRDYHLGFQTIAAAQRFPAHVHRLSACLTLQGAVAHSDMPVESGPTRLLPYSQRYAEGYLAWRRNDFREYFEAHCVQLPLARGDAVFFNPALFHAAGANRTADVRRMANLLQVSSAMGRAMESLDRASMCKAIYPVLRERRANGRIGEAAAFAAIAACAEGYPFPTNLDRDPPVGGLAPESQQALVQRALREGWEPGRFAAALSAQSARRDPANAAR